MPSVPVSLIGTATVTVRRPVSGEPDEMGEPTTVWEEEEVPGVVTHPGSTSDLEEARPDGVSIARTFHFPKAYSKSLRGCLISYAGRSYRVVGDPEPYPDADSPGLLNRTVGAEATDG